MNKKKQSAALLAAEIIIRTVFFITMPAAFASGFLAVKLIFTAIGAGEPLNIDSMWVLIGLVGFTIIFGRFFCGFVCAFGTLGDAVYSVSGFIQKKIFRRSKQLSIPEKPTVILQKIKYAVLFTIVILCSLFNDDNYRIIPTTIHPGGKIGLHTQNSGDDLNYILSGTGKAYCDGIEETLKPGVMHICPKGSEHTIINTGENDLVMLTIVAAK